MLHGTVAAPAPPLDNVATPFSRPVVGPGGPAAGPALGLTQPWLEPAPQHVQTPWGQIPLVTPMGTLVGASGVATIPVLGGASLLAGAGEGPPPSVQGSMASHHASPIGAGSTSTADFARRHDEADARAHDLEHRLTATTETLHEHSSDNKTLLREFMAGMQDAASVATRVAAEVAAAQASAADLAHPRLTALMLSNST